MSYLSLRLLYTPSQKCSYRAGEFRIRNCDDCHNRSSLLTINLYFLMTRFLYSLRLTFFYTVFYNLIAWPIFIEKPIKMTLIYRNIAVWLIYLLLLATFVADLRLRRYVVQNNWEYLGKRLMFSFFFAEGIGEILANIQKMTKTPSYIVCKDIEQKIRTSLKGIQPQKVLIEDKRLSVKYSDG